MTVTHHASGEHALQRLKRIQGPSRQFKEVALTLNSQYLQVISFESQSGCLFAPEDHHVGSS